MEKYTIIEGNKANIRTAGGKAQVDCFEITQNNGYKPFYIEELEVINLITKIRKQIIIFNCWHNLCKNTKKGDLVFLQFPSMKPRIGKNHFIKRMRKKGVNIITLIHDIESLRNMNISGFQERQYAFFMKCSNILIAHNNIMKNYLVNQGITPAKVISLEIFDYLCELKTENSEHKDEIIIAGNLNPVKTAYLSNFSEIKDVTFNLYGIGNSATLPSNSNYFGSFPPDDLPNELSGKYGLVWDGISIDKCCGPYGYYLMYNNPHKASLYLASGIPIITYRGSAISAFVRKHNIGIEIDSLQNLNQELKNITDVAYLEMKKNVNEIGKKVRSGYFLTKALSEAEDTIQYLYDNKFL